MIPGKKYNPGTFTSRRPTPERFAHLRKWVEPVVRNIDITSITELTNIDQQLEQVSHLYISSIVQRVISQLTAAYNDGFVTLRATEAGALHVQTVRETKAVTSAKIDFDDGVDEVIVTGVAGQQIKITTLVFTVGGETDIELFDGDVAITGPMDFGGATEASGMVVSQGFLPYELTADSSFIMKSSNAVQVSGYVTGYIE